MELSAPLPVRQPDRFDRAFASFRAGLAAPSDASLRTGWLALWVILPFALLLLATPFVFVNDMIFDLFIPLDGAWRMLSGQIPHVDFPTPVGALYYAVLGAAGWFGLGPKTVVVANLLVLPAVLAMTLVATRARLPRPLRLGFVLFTAFLVISPRTLDSLMISHLAAYNRHSWALVIVVMLTALLAPERRSRGWWWVEAATTTLALVALFYLKVTFFALAGGCLLLAALFGGPNRGLAFAAGAAALAMVAGALAADDMTRRYLGDLVAAARSMAVGSGADRGAKLVADIDANRLLLLLTLSLPLVALRTAAGAAERLAAARVALLSLLVVAASAFATYQNHNHVVASLPVVAALNFQLLRGRSRARADDRPGRGADGWTTWAGAVVIGLLGPPLFQDAEAVVLHTALPLTSAPQPATTTATGRAILLPERSSPKPTALERVLTDGLPPDLYLALTPDTWNSDTRTILDDALALIERHRPAAPRIASISFATPFAFLTRTEPPRGWPSWLDYGRTYSEHTVDPARLLADANVVMYPKVWPDAKMRAILTDTLAREFRLAESTAMWEIWLRGPAPSAASVVSGAPTRR